MTVDNQNYKNCINKQCRIKAGIPLHSCLIHKLKINLVDQEELPRSWEAQIETKRVYVWVKSFQPRKYIWICDKYGYNLASVCYIIEWYKVKIPASDKNGPARGVVV